MNKLDYQYKILLRSLLDEGIEKKDRTQTGTLSLFGKQIRHKMSDGFPLLTTKKMAWKTMVTELLWFLRGDTNIKYLIENDCHIWNGDAYKGYEKQCEIHEVEPMSKEAFISAIKLGDSKESHFIPNLTGYKLGELGPIYGSQWRDWNGKTEVTYPGARDENGHLKPFHIKTYGLDQIANLIKELKTNPDSRRLMVSAWNVGELDQMVLPPCHYGFQVYTRELSYEEKKEYAYKYFNKGTLRDLEDFEKFNIPARAISLMWNQRSVDTFLGLPFNIASYGLLLELIAKAVNMVPDELIGNLGDTHLYLNHVDQAKEQLKRKSFDLPKLNINTEFWPTESGEFGEGLLDAIAILNSFKDDNFCRCLLEEDLQLLNYQSHSAIKAPLSN